MKIRKSSIFVKSVSQVTHFTFIQRRNYQQKKELVETFNSFLSEVVKNLQVQNEVRYAEIVQNPEESKRIQIPF